VVAAVPGSGAVRTGEPLRVRVRCRRGPCDVRVVGGELDMTAGYDDGEPPDPVASSTGLQSGGSATLRLVPDAGSGFVHALTPTRVAVRVLACGSQGGIARLTIRPRLHRLRPRPLPHVLSLKARRTTHGIRVTWRIARPARYAEFAIQSQAFAVAGFSYTTMKGRGRTHFAVTLHPDDPRRAGRVSVTVSSAELPDGATTTVRVR
jgi:hypothetical protein